jgi:hypothetical protein
MPQCRTGTKIVRYVNPNTYRAKLMIFAGLSSKRLNDVWELDITNENNLKWEKINCKGELPMIRSEHTSVLYKNELFIFGGILEDEKFYRTKEDILIFDMIAHKFIEGQCANKNDVKWRKNHIAESVGHHMFMYGGMDEDGNILHDFWLLELIKLRWIKIDPRGIKFPGMAYHSSALVISQEKKEHATFSIFRQPDIPIFQLKNKKILFEGIYIFGGIDDSGKYLNDVYVIRICRKPLEKIILNISGIQPPPRSHASLNFYENLNVLILHGGRNDKFKKGVCYNDFWILDLELLQWSKLSTYDGISKNAVEARADHCAIIHNNNLIIFGGSNESNFLGSELLLVNLDFTETKNRKVAPRTNIAKDYKIKINHQNIGPLQTQETIIKKTDERDLKPKEVFGAFFEKGEKIEEKLKSFLIRENYTVKE